MLDIRYHPVTRPEGRQQTGTTLHVLFACKVCGIAKGIFESLI
eukprot:COSAG01_NODE_1857_length_9044_cov_24.006931_6_plen_43_part_00